MIPPPTHFVPFRDDTHAVEALRRSEEEDVGRMSRIDESAFGPKQKTAQASLLHELGWVKFHKR